MTQEQDADADSDAYERTVHSLVSRGVSGDSAEESAQAAWARGWERRKEVTGPKKARNLDPCNHPQSVPQWLPAPGKQRAFGGDPSLKREEQTCFHNPILLAKERLQ